MLTLKAPLQLHIAQPLSLGADAFSERIRGNYGLLGAHFAPKDLLFFMTAPPELPEEAGGMTTLVDQRNQVDIRSVSMDVVNNVVNRILLDGTERFTYQDQVYITAVLNRLGITNVAQFMEQVRRLRVENESVVQMTKLYRSELERLIEHRDMGEPVPSLPLPPREEEVGAPPPQDPRISLTLDILNRLDTSRIYETVYAFQHSWTGGSTTFRNQELRLSEQLRVSNQLSLAEVKQTLYQQPRLELRHHINIYEAGLEIEPPQDEEAVLSQAAAAALLSTVDSAVIQVLNRPQYRSEQWLQTQNALWQTAENALVRFESYHSQPQTLLTRETEREDAWYHYAQELVEYQTLHHTLTTLPGEARQRLPSPDHAAPPASLIWKQTQAGDEIDQRSYEETVQETLNRLEQRFEAAQPFQAPIRHDTLRQTILRQRELYDQLNTQTLRQTILRKLQPGSAPLPPEPAAPVPTVLREAETPTPEEAPAPRERFTQQLHQETRTERERLERLRERSEVVTPPAAELPLKAADIPPMPSIPAPAPSWQDQEIPLVPLTAQEAEEQAPDVLVEELRRIDQRNRTLLETIQQRERAQAPAPLVQPDLRQTMRTALRALDEPETVLRELRETQERREARTVHPDLTPREEALLEQAAPQERALYEAVLAYQKDPEGTLAKGLLRPASQSVLQAALHAAAPAEPPKLEHPAPAAEREIVREQAQSVLERMIHLPTGRQTVVEAQTPPASVRIVHKQAAPDVSEEFLEQLTERRSHEIQRTESHERVTRQQSRQVDVNQIEKTVVAQTTEDITELVNRTLSRQMRTISDQVYRQMEKKLQTERSRRGRL